MGAADASVFTRHLATVAGYDVPYLRGGRGRPLLYLHGMGGAGKWESFHMAFANDTLTFAPQLPGWQEWTPPTGIKSVADYAGIATGFLDAIETGPVTLIGHSIGAWIALYIATHHPERIDRLVLIDCLGLETPEVPAVRLGELDEEEFAKRTLARLGLIASAQPYGFGAEFTSARASPEFERQWRGRGLISDLVKGAYADSGLVSDLGSIETATLIVWGDRDGIAPSEHARLLHDKIRGSRLVIVEGAGHLPMVERRETFHRICRNFLVGVEEEIPGTMIG